MSCRWPSSTNKAGLVLAHDGDDSYYAVVLDRDADKIALHLITDGSWGSALGSDDVTINDSTAYTVKVRRKQRSVTASVGSAGFTYDSTSDFGTGQSGFYSDKTSVTFDDVVFYDGTSRDPATPRISGLGRCGVVDVPGHERFVRTMVAGATGIDLALLVVAADDSVMPQTIEHVEILDLLGVDRCVVAITKCDLADEELAALVADDVGGLLEGTSLAGAPMIPVSSVTGAGLDQLREALKAAAGGVVERRHSGPFRLAIDRVFTIQGRGTVVTGSVLRGRVSGGDALELWPAGQTCRVRGLDLGFLRSAPRLRPSRRCRWPISEPVTTPASCHASSGRPPSVGT